MGIVVPPQCWLTVQCSFNSTNSRVRMVHTQAVRNEHTDFFTWLGRVLHEIDVHIRLQTERRRSQTGRRRSQTGADVRKQGADVRKQGADVRKQGADVRKQGADVCKQGADVCKQGADVSRLAARPFTENRNELPPTSAEFR